MPNEVNYLLKRTKNEIIAFKLKFLTKKNRRMWIANVNDQNVKSIRLTRPWRVAVWEGNRPRFNSAIKIDNLKHFCRDFLTTVQRRSRNENAGHFHAHVARRWPSRIISVLMIFAIARDAVTSQVAFKSLFLFRRFVGGSYLSSTPTTPITSQLRKKNKYLVIIHMRMVISSNISASKEKCPMNYVIVHDLQLFFENGARRVPEPLSAPHSLINCTNYRNY